MNVLVVYYSLYGHVAAMAQAAVEGVHQVPGMTGVLRRVPETLSPDIIDKMGATEAQKSLSLVPECTLAELEKADAILFGTPTRFGNMDVARSLGHDTIGLATGRRSEALLAGRFPELPETALIEVADYFAFSLAQAAGRGFARLIQATFVGKLAKMAQGLANTHAVVIGKDR